MEKLLTNKLFETWLIWKLTIPFSLEYHKGKSLSEAPIFAWRHIVHWITSSICENSKLRTWGKHVVYRNWFWHSEQFCTQHVLLMLWASEKDIPVLTVKKGWHILALFGREILEVLAKVFFICKLESI